MRLEASNPNYKLNGTSTSFKSNNPFYCSSGDGNEGYDSCGGIADQYKCNTNTGVCKNKGICCFNGGLPQGGGQILTYTGDPETYN